MKSAAIIAWWQPKTLEINEPLMLSSLPASFLALVGLQLGHLVTRKRTEVVCYAIGNTDPFKQMAANRFRTRLRRKLEAVLAKFVWHRIDRIAFGTESAQILYHEVLPVPPKRMEEALIPALPAPCECNPLLGPEEDLVIYLGDLSQRKGFHKLAEAWPLVLEQLPQARLSILGKGALEKLALSLASKYQGVEVQIDPSRARIHEQLRRAKVLVLPSQQTPTWREQVGLPIVEGLAHGCRIVTTTQTGLASWLAFHSHTTLDPDFPPSALSKTVKEHLSAPIQNARICAVLPDRDGRLDADTWLFGDKSIVSQRK
ncbi:glycosyltransferase [Arthrobacter psychrolactophilus]